MIPMNYPDLPPLHPSTHEALLEAIQPKEPTMSQTIILDIPEVALDPDCGGNATGEGHDWFEFKRKGSMVRFRCANCARVDPWIYWPYKDPSALVSVPLAEMNTHRVFSPNSVAEHWVDDPTPYLGPWCRVFEGQHKPDHSRCATDECECSCHTAAPEMRGPTTDIEIVDEIWEGWKPDETVSMEIINPNKPSTSTNYWDVTRDGLRDLCKRRGMSGYGSLNKAGLVSLLEADDLDARS